MYRQGQIFILFDTNLKIITYKSEKEGKKVLFLGSIHGDEHCGTEAINSVIEELNQKKLVLLNGSISFIPICNPEAFKRNTRFYEVNLNRSIQKYDNLDKYEQKLANQIADYISDSDVIIDLHSMLAPDARPFIFNYYPEELSIKIAK